MLLAYGKSSMRNSSVGSLPYVRPCRHIVHHLRRRPRQHRRTGPNIPLGRSGGDSAEAFSNVLCPSFGDFGERGRGKRTRRSPRTFRKVLSSTWNHQLPLKLRLCLSFKNLFPGKNRVWASGDLGQFPVERFCGTRHVPDPTDFLTAQA